MAGVDILLERNARIPFDLRQSPNARVCVGDRNGRSSVRYLRIQNCQARFGKGGVVEVKMPGDKVFRPVFKELEVLEIREIHGNLLEQSYSLCVECFRNTGKIIPADATGTKFECTECGHSWTI